MSAIKVRFAPSPTGYMHIGNTRTAIFNWLLAKKLGGEFMLRIDDTDKERSKKEYEDAIRESLNWLGLTWTEEARQFARFARYQEVTEKLMQEGRIYACYETAEELDMMRKKLMTKGLPPIYDRGALKLTEEQIGAYKAEGRKPHYRFKLIDGDIVWNDLVRGECRYNAANLSDPVIIRADGSYLYHLPSVIDDFDFGITHIVRGEDHVTNTAAQIQMFEAIGGTPPQFAHLPLLTGKEGKLSKRLGSIGVLDLRARGIEAMAICSYLSKLGTSEAIEPFYDLESLAQTLDFNKLGRSQPKFSEEDLARFKSQISFVGRLYSTRLTEYLNYLPDYKKGFFNAMLDFNTGVYDSYIVEDIFSRDMSKWLDEKAFRNVVYKYESKDPKLPLTDDEMAESIVPRIGLLTNMTITNRERILLISILSNQWQFKLFSNESNELFKNVDFGGTVSYYREMPKVFKCSDINLNITFKSIKTGIPLRCLDIMGCGGFLLSNYQKDFDDHFKDGENVALFNSLDEAYDKCDYYLNHDSERIKVARNGHDTVAKYYTYRDQLIKAFKMAGLDYMLKSLGVE